MELTKLIRIVNCLMHTANTITNYAYYRIAI